MTSCSTILITVANLWLNMNGKLTLFSYFICLSYSCLWFLLRDLTDEEPERPDMTLLESEKEASFFLRLIIEDIFSRRRLFSVSIKIYRSSSCCFALRLRTCSVMILLKFQSLGLLLILGRTSRILQNIKSYSLSNSLYLMSRLVNTGLLLLSLSTFKFCQSQFETVIFEAISIKQIIHK